MSRNREDRRKAIASEAAVSRAEGGSFSGPAYIISEAELAKLGIKNYILDSGDKPEDGRTHAWSFLEPHIDDPCVVGMGLYIHYDIGINKERILCPRFMKKEFDRLQAAWPDADFKVPDAIKHGKCPICERRDINVAHYKAERESMEEQERKTWHTTNIYNLEPFNGGFIDPKPNRYIGWIVDEKILDDGVQVVEFPTGGKNNAGVHKGLMDQAVDRDTGQVLDVLDPSKDGWKFSFFRQGKGKAASYSSHKLSPRGEALDKEWLEAVPRFTDVLVFADYATIKEAFNGVVSEPEETRERTEPAEEPRRRGRAEEAEAVGDELVEAITAPAEEPRRRRRGAEDETNPQSAPGAANHTRGDQGNAATTSPSEPRRRRQAEEPKDDEPSDEAKAIAEQVRNRPRRRESSGD